MRFRKKKKDGDMDPTTKKLLDQGLIRIKTSEEPEESAVQKLRDIGAVTFDFWSGVKYILVLSTLLWWLPLFGPMLTGYVGGRRTGGPKKGLLAAVIGLVVIGVVHLAITREMFPSQIQGLFALPATLVAAAYEVPALASYMPFLEMYWTSFFGAILGGLPYSSNSYIITAIFAYIGGIIAVDKEREVSRALNKKEPKVTIDMSKTAMVPSAPVAVRSWANPQEERRRTTSAAQQREINNRKHLRDLKKIQFENPGHRRSSNTVSRSSKDLVRHENQRGQNNNHQVRHHSIPEGDDWEIL
ncbi:MAG: hypothetical protein R6U17_04745 [Thermoplasmata archaeon]